MTELSKTLTAAGIAIGILSYFCKEGIDALERRKASLDGELTAYRHSSGHQTTQLQILASRQQLDAIQGENRTKKRKKAQNIDYSGMVLRDIGNVRGAQALVGVAIDDLSRLIEKLPLRSANLRHTFEQMKNDLAAKKSKIEEQLKPTPENDWARMAQLKLAIISTAIDGLPILVFGDTIITRAKAQVRILDFVVGFGRWTARILFILGVCLTIYGLFKGVKVGGVAE
jgi:hypothetical protein